MLEIEIKVQIEERAAIRERILASGGKLLEKGIEFDAYYTSPNRDFAQTDEALRLRNAGNIALLTYKGPKTGPGPYKAREELNVRIESSDMMDAILDRIGFVHTAGVRKYRESYRLGQATVTLDEVDDLGTFAEIEAAGNLGQEDAEKEIERIAGELGITGERITRSYLELLLEKQRSDQS